MSAHQPFHPVYGSNQVLTPAASSATATLSSAGRQVRLTNTGANICYVRLGATAVAATTADYAIPAGVSSIISRGHGDVSLTHISAAGTTLQVCTGNGW